MFIVCVCVGWCVSCLGVGVLINELFAIGPIGFSLIIELKLVDDRMQTILFIIHFASMKQQKYTSFHEMPLSGGCRSVYSVFARF